MHAAPPMTRGVIPPKPPRVKPDEVRRGRALRPAAPPARAPPNASPKPRSQKIISVFKEISERLGPWRSPSTAQGLRAAGADVLEMGMDPQAARWLTWRAASMMHRAAMGEIMPVNPELLEILVCPETRQPVAQADASLLAKLNTAIEARSLRNRGGEAVAKPIEEGLLREDGKVLYVVDDGIPVMLVEESIEIPS